MRFGLIVEADGRPGFSMPQRYDEIVNEASAFAMQPAAWSKCRCVSRTPTVV